MKAIGPICVLVLVAGCASTEPTRVAAADCKVVPYGHATAGLRERPSDALEKRMASLQLSSSEYRIANLDRYGRGPLNTVEEALNDCER